MHQVYLLLGSNIENREQYLFKATHFLKGIGEVIKRSSVYETAAWGKLDQSTFLNQAVLLKTKLAANELLDNILLIEVQMGRKRLEKYGPRTIDIDILFFDEEVIDTARLIVPHPAIEKRRFTLEPLVEIAPSIIHPKLKKTVQLLLKECTDTLEVQKFNDPTI